MPTQMSKYQNKVLIGKGAFGKAYVVDDVEDDRKYVIKVVNLHDMPEKEIAQAVAEGKILERLRHPYIIGFKEMFVTKDNKLCTVLDLATNGDLYHKLQDLKASNKSLSEEQILLLIVQLTLSIKYCHDLKIIHRDIKSQNILLDKNDNVLLADFGIASILQSTASFSRTQIGTPFYLSPELVLAKPYSFASDIWAMGVVLYEMMTLTFPFQGKELAVLAKKITQGKFASPPAHFSADLRNLVSKMMDTDPAKRPTPSDILKTPFLKSTVKRALDIADNFASFEEVTQENHGYRVDFTKPPPPRIDAEDGKINYSEAFRASMQTSNGSPKSPAAEDKKPAEASFGGNTIDGYSARATFFQKMVSQECGVSEDMVNEAAEEMLKDEPDMEIVEKLLGGPEKYAKVKAAFEMMVASKIYVGANK